MHWKQGQHTTSAGRQRWLPRMPGMYALLTGLLATIVVVLSIVLVLNLRRSRHLRSRVHALPEQLREVASDASVGRRLDAADDDALAPLHTTLNQLFDTLQSRDEALTERENGAARLAQALPDIVFIHTDRILFANAATAALIGVESNQLVDKPITDLVKPPYRALLRETTTRRLAGGEAPARQQVQLLSVEEGAIWVEISSALTTYRGTQALMTIARRIDTERRTSRRGMDDDVRMDLALEAMAESVVMTDRQGVITALNSAAEATLGVRRRDAIGAPFGRLATLVDEIDHKALGDPVERCLTQRRRINMGRRALLLRPSGNEQVSVELTASPIEDENTVKGVVVVFHDVGEIRGHARKISYQASHDALTGLINRREFEQRVQIAVDETRSGTATHMLAYLDLDRFKIVNDSCGHQAGDDLLRKVAAILREQVRDSDSVARIGGDEFAMLLTGCPLEKAMEIADNTCSAIADYRFVWRDRIFTIGVSIGLLQMGDNSGSVQDVLAAADSACYMAKRSGRGQVHVYAESDQIVTRERGEIRWLQRLQAALKDGGFGLAVQPIISMGAHSPLGPACEVLLRLRRRHGELINPGEFLAAAERYQLMPEIDRWVVRATFASIANHEIILPKGRSCGINISGQTLSDAGFLEFVVDALDTSAVAPESICFEVTEEAVYEHFANAQRFIEVLHGMGSRFALDNYGSAPGAFSRLRDLPIDFLKIDGRLTRNLSEDSVNQELVASMIRLADTMRFRTVAEEVEAQDDFDTLRDLGVDFAQGYFIREPAMVGGSQ
ncbi:MAG: EAL domain-containing protein [Pseudomonadota bacterium]